MWCDDSLKDGTKSHSPDNPEKDDPQNDKHPSPNLNHPFIINDDFLKKD
jgi:hypothetical protein